jgi:hypothetical protein
MGIKNKDSETFYPHRYIHKEIIETDYKVIEGFFKMHQVTFSLRSEFSNLGGEYITDSLSLKTSSAKKWAKSETEITLFNHAVSHLNNARMFIRYKMKPGEQVGHIYYETSNAEAKVSEH